MPLTFLLRTRADCSLSTGKHWPHYDAAELRQAP